jgi:hypothetical protein
MRHIEEAAKPVASALILGNHRVLRPLDQLQLAALFCLINCRLEFTDRASMAIPASSREWLRKNLAPSPNWHIWIASYCGAYPGTHASHHWGMRLVPASAEYSPSNECNTQIATMVVGGLCVYLFSSTVMNSFPGYISSPMCRIWPPSQFYVDPWFAPGLSDDEIIRLYEAFPAKMKVVGED